MGALDTVPKGAIVWGLGNSGQNNTIDLSYEAKKLGYSVQGLYIRKWQDEGYELCLEGIRAKFHQNPSLMQMLLATKPKLLAEATTDRTWGTGIHLRLKRVG